MTDQPAPAEQRPDLTVDTDAVDPERAVEGAAKPGENPGACPGGETVPNRCECGCEGCAHHCAAHQPASTAPLASGMPLVTGHCPACGWQSLFLGDGGYVTCARLECPTPDAASTLLEQQPAPPDLRQRITDALNRLLRAKGYDPEDPDVDHAQFDRETAEVVDAIMPVVQPAPASPDQLTADEARDLADELSTDLYKAQDAVAFVAECLTIREREQPGQPVTTAEVRRWLEGAKCGRQLAAEADGTDHAQCPRKDPHPPHMWTWQEDGVDCPGLSPGDPPPVTLCVPADAEKRLTHRDACHNAALAAHREWLRPGGPTGQEPLAVALADAVMAVRDTELEQARAELARRDAAESADAAAGSHAGRAEQAEAELVGARATIEHMSKAMSWIAGHDRQGLDHMEEAQQEARDREAAEAAIARVRQLHARTVRLDAAVCAHCHHVYPCPTIRALDGTQQPTEEADR